MVNSYQAMAGPGFSEHLALYTVEFNFKKFNNSISLLKYLLGYPVSDPVAESN